MSVKCDPEWQILVTELRAKYDQNANDLVASVTGLIRALCVALTELADDESDSSWADKLWEKLGGGPRTLSLFTEVR